MYSMLSAFGDGVTEKTKVLIFKESEALRLFWAAKHLFTKSRSSAKSRCASPSDAISVQLGGDARLIRAGWGTLSRVLPSFRTCPAGVYFSKMKILTLH